MLQDISDESDTENFKNRQVRTRRVTSKSKIRQLKPESQLDYSSEDSNQDGELTIREKEGSSRRGSLKTSFTGRNKVLNDSSRSIENISEDNSQKVFIPRSSLDRSKESTSSSTSFARSAPRVMAPPSNPPPYSRNQNLKSQDWVKLPKKFLDEDSGFDDEDEPETRGFRNSASSTTGNAPSSWKASAPKRPSKDSEPSSIVDLEDTEQEDSDNQSQHSSDTIQGPDVLDQPVCYTPSSVAKKPSKSKEKRRGSGAGTKKNKPTAEPPSEVPGNRLIVSDDNKKDTFSNYIERTNLLGITLPRKSGRYDSTEDLTENEHTSSTGTVNSRLLSTAGTTEDGSSNGRAYSKKQVSLDVPPGEAFFQSRKEKIPKPLSVKSSSWVGGASFVQVAHSRGTHTDHVQCTVVRFRNGLHSKMYPTYELILDDPKKPLILARKMNMNRTSNYHLFDLTRGQLSQKLSKKSGSYLGKLRAKNTNRTEYGLMSRNSEKEELAGVLFDKLSILNQLKDGTQPRKMRVLVPCLDENQVPVPFKVSGGDSLSGRLVELEENRKRDTGLLADGCKMYETKDPVYENGNYRLNFNGRVKLPSVKNFQLVAKDDIDDVICQFGKVAEDVFHLDFKAPMNAYQAFAFALGQFNL